MKTNHSGIKCDPINRIFNFLGEISRPLGEVAELDISLLGDFLYFGRLSGTFRQLCEGEHLVTLLHIRELLCQVVTHHPAVINLFDRSANLEDNGVLQIYSNPHGKVPLNDINRSRV